MINILANPFKHLSTAILCVLLFLISAHGAPLYWFSDGTNPGGSGTWDDATGNRWSTDPTTFTGVNGNGIWVNGGHAVIDPASGANFEIGADGVEVNRVDLLNISSNDRGLTGGAGTLTFTGSNPMITASTTATRDPMLAANMAGANGLTLAAISGSGLYRIEGDNSALNGVITLNNNIRLESATGLGVATTGAVNDPNRVENPGGQILMQGASFDLGATIIGRQNSTLAFASDNYTYSGNLYVDSATVQVNAQQEFTVQTLSGDFALAADDSRTLRFRAQRIGGRLIQTGLIEDGSATGSLAVQALMATNTTTGHGSAGDRTLELRGANTYSGGTSVSVAAGATAILLANNTSGSATGSGAVTIAGNGVFAGYGHVDGDVNVQEVSNFITAGDIASSKVDDTNLDFLPTLSQADQSLNTLGLGGNLTISSEYRAFLGALDETVGYTQLHMTGDNVTLTLGGDSTLTLDFLNDIDDPDSGNPFWNTARSWTIISFTGDNTSISGTFENVNLGDFAQGEFSLIYSDADGVTLSYIPEPAAISLLMGGVVGLLIVMLRRRRC